MLETILAISGKPGLYKLVSRGNRNLIVESLDERHHRQPAFATDKVISLADIAMYTDAEEVPLADVLTALQKKENGQPASLDYKTASKEQLFDFFAEILPKTIGTTRWRSLTGFTARTLRLLIWVLFPIVWCVEKLTHAVTPQSAEEETSVSREEVSAMANVGEEEGVFDKDENKIIQNIIKLDDVKAYDIMTPRVVCSTAAESMTLHDFYEDDKYDHFSRIPVYADSPEFITGYILRSDALEMLAEDKFQVRLSEIRRPLPYFHEETAIPEIWDSLIEHKEQIAIVIDDYGAMQGIITLEDVIETVFGLEITDENDQFTDMQQYARERWQQRQKRFQTVKIKEAKQETKNEQA